MTTKDVERELRRAATETKKKIEQHVDERKDTVWQEIQKRLAAEQSKTNNGQCPQEDKVCQKRIKSPRANALRGLRRK